MNKEIRINWNVGMELTPETFIHQENLLAEYRLLLRKVQASKEFGLIPNTVFKVPVSIQGDKLILAEVECHALLPKGDLINLKRTEEVELKIVGSNDCYLAVWPTAEVHEYELDEVPFLENEYQFGLCTLDELPDRMPLVKITLDDGVWKVQDDYITPVIAMESSPVMMEMTGAIRHLAQQITHHEKFKFLNNHDIMYLLVEEMDSLDRNQNPKDFVTLCRRFVRLLSYLSSTIPITNINYNPYDIQLFLNGICSFLIQFYDYLPALEIVEYHPIPKQERKDEPEPEPEDECPIL